MSNKKRKYEEEEDTSSKSSKKIKEDCQFDECFISTDIGDFDGYLIKKGTEIYHGTIKRNYEDVLKRGRFFGSLVIARVYRDRSSIENSETIPTIYKFKLVKDIKLPSMDSCKNITKFRDYIVTKFGNKAIDFLELFDKFFFCKKNVATRTSLTKEDIKLTKMLCSLGLDGFANKEMKTKHDFTFHAEIFLCDPKEYIEYVEEIDEFKPVKVYKEGPIYEKCYIDIAVKDLRKNLKDCIEYRNDLGFVYLGEKNIIQDKLNLYITFNRKYVEDGSGNMLFTLDDLTKDHNHRLITMILLIKNSSDIDKKRNPDLYKLFTDKDIKKTYKYYIFGITEMTNSFKKQIGNDDSLNRFKNDLIRKLLGVCLSILRSYSSLKFEESKTILLMDQFINGNENRIFDGVFNDNIFGFKTEGELKYAPLQQVLIKSDVRL